MPPAPKRSRAAEGAQGESVVEGITEHVGNGEVLQSTSTSQVDGDMLSGHEDGDNGDGDNGELMQLPTKSLDSSVATTTAQERAEAAEMRSGTLVNNTDAASQNRAGPVSVEIEPGVQKYVLIEVMSQPARCLVRGRVAAEYHKDAARETVHLLQQVGLPYKVLGGGRIDFRTDHGGRIKIYGHSFGFPWEGAARHDLTAQLCEVAFPEAYVEVTNDEY